MEYLIWKLIHLLFVVIFLGNIATGLFWARFANRSNNAAIIAHTFAGIIRSDRFFTLPAVFGIIIAGVAAAIIAGFPLLSTAWIFWGLVLFIVSGIVFSVRVAPLQKKIVRLMEKGSDLSASDREQYRRMFKAWEGWGLLALLMPVLAMIIMVLKPALPGF